MVTLLDEIYLLRVLAGIWGIPACDDAADADCDGDIDGRDGVVILSKVAGLPAEDCGPLRAPRSDAEAGGDDDFTAAVAAPAAAAAVAGDAGDGALAVAFAAAEAVAEDAGKEAESIAFLAGAGAAAERTDGVLVRHLKACDAPPNGWLPAMWPIRS
jgi:hypothetical protein